jgi:hypothetical protein
VTTPNLPIDKRRAGVRRTVLFLFACALASYGLFLYTALQHR